MAIKPDVSDAWAQGGSVTDPGSVKTLLGWIAEIPTFQVFNWILNRTDTFLQHLNERGILAWDNVTVYVEGAKAQGSDGVIYYLPPGGGTSTNEDPTLGLPWVKEVSGIANEWESDQVILEDTISYAVSQAIDVSANQNGFVELTGNMTITSFDNPKAGGVYVLRVKQDGVAGHTITWPSNVRWPYGLAPVLTTVANEQDLFSFYYTGTQFLGGIGANYPV